MQINTQRFKKRPDTCMNRDTETNIHRELETGRVRTKYSNRQTLTDSDRDTNKARSTDTGRDTDPCKNTGIDKDTASCTFMYSFIETQT